MKKGKTIKYVLLILGVLLLLLAGNIPMLKANYYDAYMEHEQWSKNGFHLVIWYVLVFANVLLFAIGYFKNHLAFKICYYVLLALISYVGIRFELMRNEHHAVFNITREPGYYIAIAGSVLITLATIVSLHSQKKKKEVVFSESDILDTKTMDIDP